MKPNNNEYQLKVNTKSINKTMNNMKTAIKILSLMIALVSISSCSKNDDEPQLDPTLVAIPDANFEQALIDLGIDTNGLNGNILRTDAEAVIILDVAEKNISSLQGIEAFINVIDFTCDENELTSLDVSKLSALKYLYCSENQLTSLDFSNNLVLDDVECAFNQLTSINLTKNTLLRDIYATGNQLTTLDVSHNLLLDYLAFSENKISNIDVSNNVLLEKIFCSDNQLNSLDLSTNAALIGLNAKNNSPLEFINIKNGNNTNMTFFTALESPNLQCVEVDNSAYSTALWSAHADAQVNFSEDCNN